MSGSPATLDQLDEEIRNAQYREAADTFCRLVVEENVPIRDGVAAAVRAAAPFVQVPSHLMRKPNGELRGVNYDHTILGWRGAVALMSYLPKRQAVLPAVQAMWYVPQGLNIWEQLLCEFPGHYARDAEKCGSRLGPPEEEHDRFDGPAWTPPKIYFADHAPILEGSVDDRLDRLTWAIAEGDRDQSYALFVGLSQDPANRERLKEAALFSGIIDLQDTLINHGGYQNIGHKALRARALCDLADYLGWDNAHEVIYTVVPDLGCAPRLHGLWTEIQMITKVELPNITKISKRSDMPMTELEMDRLTEVLLWGGPHEVNMTITELFRRGAGILDISDGIAVCYQRYLTDVLDHPNAFGNPMHAFDYLNVVNTWIRHYENPHQAKAVYMAARFVNDAIRYNAMFPRDPSVELPRPAEYRRLAENIATDRLLPALGEAILAQEAPLAMSVVNSYLERTAERSDLLTTITYASSHFQNDPHIMRNCTSSIEEWTNNQTSRRDDILRGWVKHQSRYIKRARAQECFELYSQYFRP